MYLSELCACFVFFAVNLLFRQPPKNITGFKAVSLHNKQVLFIIILITWNFLPITLHGQELSFSKDKVNYRQIFQDRYEDALKFVNENKWISDSLRVKGIDPDFALAIVFPELIRFSAIQDKMEVGGLLALYVQYGEKYADFSVGRFQMKPTFAEQLENDATKIPSLKCDSFNSANTSQARIERVNRLNDLKWQVKYLALFLKVMEDKYAYIKWDNEDERLKFYATAYNSGYTLGEEKILNRINSKMFYTGLIKGDICYCYAAIADYYFNTIK